MAFRESRAAGPQVTPAAFFSEAEVRDPLGGMSVTEAGFAAMSRILLDIARKHCGGKALFVLEGGYDLKGLASSVKSVVMELKNQSIYPYEKKGEASTAIVQLTTTIKRLLIPYWGHF